MNLLWEVIGAAGGFVLGLTGAGGAIISVPLFVHAGGLSVRHATVVALVIVVLGAAFNWFAQRRNVDYLAAGVLAAASVVGSRLLVPVKAAAPTGLIVGLFSAVALFSLYAVWKRDGRPPAGQAGRVKVSGVGGALVLVPAGVLIGGLVTMTGLGGGTLLMPFFIGVMGFSFPRAVATSLFGTMLVAGGSLLAQQRLIVRVVDASHFLDLVLGAVAAAVLVRLTVRRMPVGQVNEIRRWILTVVVIFAVAGMVSRMG